MAPPATPSVAPAGAPPIESPAAPAVAVPASPLPAPVLTADELLAKLETADKDLRTLTANIQYVKAFPEAQGGDTHTRRGEMSFANLDPGLATGRPRRMFAVTFNELIIGETRRMESRGFVFDGSWLVERDETAKQFFKRRVVAPGSTADPMRIGEGPLPLPIGQRRADIVGRFEAVTVSPLDAVPEGLRFAKLRALLTDTHQLKLTPRPKSTQARDYTEIRLWYRIGDLLPVFAQSITPDGSKHEIFLLNTKKNEKLNDAVFSTAEPSRQDGWAVDVTEFRAETGESVETNILRSPSPNVEGTRDPKAEPKPEPKPEAKPAAKPEANPEAKPEPKLESKPANEPAPKK